MMIMMIIGMKILVQFAYHTAAAMLAVASELCGLWWHACGESTENDTIHRSCSSGFATIWGHQQQSKIIARLEVVPREDTAFGMKVLLLLLVLPKVLSMSWWEKRYPNVNSHVYHKCSKIHVIRLWYCNKNVVKTYAILTFTMRLGNDNKLKKIC